MADSDRQPEVRDAAVETLMAAYRCFGERITNDLRKARPKRINYILDRFEDIVPSTEAIAKNSMKQPPRTPAARPASRGDVKRPQTSGTLGRLRKKTMGDGDRASAAGSVGTSELEAEYEVNLPDPNFIDLSDRGIVEKIQQDLKSTKTEWEDRNKQLRKVLLFIELNIHYLMSIYIKTFKE